MNLVFKQKAEKTQKWCRSSFGECDKTTSALSLGCQTHCMVFISQWGECSVYGGSLGGSRSPSLLQDGLWRSVWPSSPMIHSRSISLMFFDWFLSVFHKHVDCFCSSFVRRLQVPGCFSDVLSLNLLHFMSFLRGQKRKMLMLKY